MFDVALYGHLTKDIIFDGFDQSYDIGSMANVWNALLETNPELTISMHPTAIGEALILVDKKTSLRVSKPQLNLMVNKKPTISEAKWSHVLYANNLPDLEFVPSLKGIVSFDLSCGGNMDINYLKYVDYLFLAQEDLFMDFSELRKIIKGWVIVHRPDGSVTASADKIYKHSTELIHGINVLGAGDIFTANVMNNILSGMDISESVSLSHTSTRKSLMKRNIK